MPEAAAVVSLEGVTVAYGANRALRDVTSSFATGAVGLLGPNGAGKSTMIKALLGFITAASLVRPSKSVLDLEPASVIKRMKDKAFARAVKREDLRAGAELLGLPIETHIGNVIESMRERADELGLRGSL